MLTEYPSYNSFTPELANARYRARKWCHNFNAHFPCGPEDTAETLLAHRRDALKQIIGKVGEEAYLEPPFYLDYGYAILRIMEDPERVSKPQPNLQVRETHADCSDVMSRLVIASMPASTSRYSIAAWSRCEQ